MAGLTIPSGMLNRWLKKENEPEDVNSVIDNLIDLGGVDGLFCTDLEEPLPKFRSAQCENIIEGKNNSYIVLGRDRDSNLGSGCGGGGFIQAGMIDLVAGRYALNSADEMKKGNPPIGKEEKVNPNFTTDAARIYITQKSLNIDKYFGFDNTTIGDSRLKEKSAIGIKADHVRMIARDTVRIYAGGATNIEGLSKNQETNSTGGELLPGKGKIELVAGNGMESNLQPAVLGDKLVEYLNSIEDKIQDLNSSVRTIAQHLMALNGTLAIITQGSSPFSTNLKEDIEIWVEQIFGDINSELRRLNSLNGLEIIGGADSIVSSNVFVS